MIDFDLSDSGQFQALLRWIEEVAKDSDRILGRNPFFVAPDPAHWVHHDPEPMRFEEFEG